MASRPHSAPGYRPRFRHWLGPAGVPLFVSPAGKDFADPARGVFLCASPVVAYGCEGELHERGPGAVPRFVVACT